jgi:hypothetical protein
MNILHYSQCKCQRQDMCKNLDFVSYFDISSLYFSLLLWCLNFVLINSPYNFARILFNICSASFDYTNKVCEIIHRDESINSNSHQFNFLGYRYFHSNSKDDFVMTFGYL